VKRSLRCRYSTILLWVVSGSAEPFEIGVKAMEGAEDLDVQALKDSSAYGARNVQIVAAGTGEALPGPATCGVLPESSVL
jgi:hypothetical protein